MLTTSGFHNEEARYWPSSLHVFFVILSMVGGCTGSTSGGLKIFRFQIIYRTLRAQMYRMILPHGVFTPTYRGQAVESHTVYSVLTLMTLYALFLSLFVVVFILYGFKVQYAIELAVNVLSNSGCQFFDFRIEYITTDLKWIMSLGMLLGRLEFLTILIILMPAFWKK